MAKLVKAHRIGEDLVLQAKVVARLASIGYPLHKLPVTDFC